MKFEVVFVKQINENFEQIGHKNLNINEQIKSNIKTLKAMKRRSSHERIDSKKVNATDLTVSYEGKTFIIPQKFHTIKNRRSIQLFIDWEKEEYLFFKEHKSIFDAKFLDKLLNNQIIGQLIGKLRKSMEKPESMELLRKLAVPVLCLVAGVFIGAYAL